MYTHILSLSLSLTHTHTHCNEIIDSEIIHDQFMCQRTRKSRVLATRHRAFEHVQVSLPIYLSSACSTRCGVWKCEKRPIKEQKRSSEEQKRRDSDGICVCLCVGMWVVGGGAGEDVVVCGRI